jgi:hypothetical protein
MKIRPVGAEVSMRTDGQTDMTKIIVSFRNSAKASKNATEKIRVLKREADRTIHALKYCAKF